MSCLLPLVFGVCLANPSELQITADASIQAAGSYHYYVGGRDVGTGTLGRVQLAMNVPVGRFSFRYGIEHTSLIETTADRGQERIFAGFTYRPFVRSAL
jgi:hypothetical protein